MEIIGEIVKCVVEELQRERSAAFTEEEQLRRRKDTLESEHNNLIDTIAGGFNSHSFRAAIPEREKEIEEINLTFETAKSEAFVPDFKQLSNSRIRSKDAENQPPVGR